MLTKNPVAWRPIQMFAIEFAAAFVMVLFIPGREVPDMLTTPLIAGGAAGVAGLLIGLYEKQLIARERLAAGPVISGAKLQPKRKKKEAEREEQPAAAPRPAFGAQPSEARTPAVAPAAATSTERPAVGAGRAPFPAGPAGAPATAGQPPTPPVPAAARAEAAPASAGGPPEDRLPTWMEKAMAQAQMASAAGESDSASQDQELTQEELRARLEQPVNLGMPVKEVAEATAAVSEGASALDEIDSLVGATSSAQPAAPARPSAPAPAASGAGRAIQAAVIHTDPDQRRHIASMLSGIGLSVVVEADSEEDGLLALLEKNVDVIVTSPDVSAQSPAEYVGKLRKASQFALIVGYGREGFEGLRELAAVWTPGGPVPAELAQMLGL